MQSRRVRTKQGKLGRCSEGCRADELGQNRVNWAGAVSGESSRVRKNWVNWVSSVRVQSSRVRTNRVNWAGPVRGESSRVKTNRVNWAGAVRDAEWPDQDETRVNWPSAIGGCRVAGVEHQPDEEGQCRNGNYCQVTFTLWSSFPQKKKYLRWMKSGTVIQV